MIKAAGHDADGRPILFLGLTGGNLGKLARNMPILVRTAELGMRPGFEVWILGGPTLGAIYSDLETVGMVVPDDAVEDPAGVLCFATFYALTGPPRPVVVLGVGDRAAPRLLAGETVAFTAGELAGHLPPPRVVLLADADTDRLTERIAAVGGGPARLTVDLRGGRTD